MGHLYRYHGYDDFLSYFLLDYQEEGSIMDNRIKELRARHNLKQSDLAKLVKVRRETILYIEKGKFNPSLKLAHNIAVSLKSDLYETFSLDKEKIIEN